MLGLEQEVKILDPIRQVMRLHLIRVAPNGLTSRQAAHMNLEQECKTIVKADGAAILFSAPPMVNARIVPVLRI